MNHKLRKSPFAKKSFGQNFLVDQKYIDRIVSAVDIAPNDTVIEIGPGRGALTERLVENAARVVAIELDRDLIPPLREKFGFRENFEIVEQDALTVDFERLAIDTTPFKLVANLPYYISTAILQHLIEQRQVFSQMVLMFQREVVDRIVAPPGSSERGFLTVMVEAYLETRRLFDVPPAAFRPIPKVSSSVAVFRPKAGGLHDQAKFRTVVSTAFAQKRKTILNNLKQIYPNAGELLSLAGIDSKQRAESLTADEWATLVKIVENSER